MTGNGPKRHPATANAAAIDAPTVAPHTRTGFNDGPLIVWFNRANLESIKMELGLRGKRVLITGASRGLGKAIAEVLAAEGCDLILHARDATRLQSLADALCEQHGISISCLAGDLAPYRQGGRGAERAGRPVPVAAAGAMLAIPSREERPSCAESSFLR